MANGENGISKCVCLVLHLRGERKVLRRDGAERRRLGAHRACHEHLLVGARVEALEQGGQQLGGLREKSKPRI